MIYHVVDQILKVSINLVYACNVKALNHGGNKEYSKLLQALNEI